MKTIEESLPVAKEYLAAADTMMKDCGVQLPSREILRTLIDHAEKTAE